MSNYVRNYVFCNEELYNNLLRFPDNQSMFEFERGVYDPEGYELADGRKLVIFETRGMDYKQDAIEKIISRYHDTLWYCIEENNVEQGTYRWDGNSVSLTKRDLQEASGGCILDLKYMDCYWRPLKSIFVYRDKVIIEEHLQNKKAKYELCSEAGNEITGFVNQKMESMMKERPPFGEYPLSIEKEIWNDFSLWNLKTGEDCIILNYDNERISQNDIDEGERCAEDIILFLERFFAKNGITTRLRYDRVVEFLEKVTG